VIAWAVAGEGNGHLPPSGIARGLGLAGQNLAEGGPLATVWATSQHSEKRLRKNSAPRCRRCFFWLKNATSPKNAKNDKMSGHDFRDCPHDWALAGCVVGFMIGNVTGLEVAVYFRTLACFPCRSIYSSF